MKERIQYLDSIRGLAAFSVVVFHIIGSHWSGEKFAVFSNLLCNGSDAVSLFFVLSGLVLSLPFLQTQAIPNINIASFALQRIFRIMPVYLVSLVLMYAYLHRWALHSSVFYVETFKNKYHLYEQIILVRGWLDKIYGPAWTLAIELVVSMLIPVFVIVIRVNKKLFYFLILLVLFANKFYLTIFIFHFLLGIIIANHFSAIQNDNTSIFYKNRYILLFLSLVLFSWRHILHLFPLPIALQKISDEFLFGDIFIVTATGAFGILLFIINSKKIQNILVAKPLLFLGKLSYCIYLTHWMFTTFFVDHWKMFVPIFGESNMLGTMVLFVLPTTLLASLCLHYGIEKPFNAFGKKWLVQKV